MHLRRRMLETISEIRQKENMGGKSGRYYAFLTQQFVNAELFLTTEKPAAAGRKKENAPAEESAPPKGEESN